MSQLRGQVIDWRMRRFKVLATALSAAAAFASIVLSAAATPDLSGTDRTEKGGISYVIAGRHSVLGDYHGELALRRRQDGRFDVQRTVIYDSFRFEGRRVQELWLGLGDLNNGQLKLSFKLKQADLFARVDEMTRKPEEWKTPALIPYSIRLAEDTCSTRIVTPCGTLAEKISKAQPAAGEAFWKDEREAVQGNGDCFQIIGNWADSTIFLPITLKYRNNALTAPFAGRSEFKSGNQYFISDHTDFLFLRSHPDLLRVANKVTDKISLVEESLRADAYAPTLRQKADYFDKDMQQQHLNELGLFSGRLVDASGKQRFVANGDGALWSGMYAGSQAMRWLAVKDPEALANFKRVTKGLMLLMDLTDNPAEFARTAEQILPGENLPPEWRRGPRPHKQIKYLCGGNNDMIKGLFHAFAWAYEILPDGDPLLLEVSEHARRLPQLRVSAGEKNHPGNFFSARGLAALASGNRDDLHQYLQFYNMVLKPIDFLNLDKGFYYGGIADWSGVNLGMVSQVTDILIAKNLARKYSIENNAEGRVLKTVLFDLRRKLLNSWSVYANARRDFYTIAADTFAATDTPALKFPEGSRPESWCRKDSWPEKRKQAVWSLREIPVQRTNHFIQFDYRLKPEWCASSWPRLPWKSFTENPPMEFHLQGAYDYPSFQGAALESDNLWTSAFQFEGQSSGRIRHGRTDYLHVYWMGRLSGLIDEAS